MRICSMTATFGKLEGETLEFTPGLNLISAPNEWGKSTWCAFLLAMLYGIDTRQRAKQGQLPDKERFKPWSGKPMSGSMEILWQGRRITIQRQTKGRIPMGQFQAFETETGLPVPELTADTCGQVLLGAERSVYQRTGFLRGGDLAVSQDEALSRRLNQLVTTGDDSPAAPALAAGLRELKNKCQYHKSGLLPQARQALADCREKLQALEALEAQAAGLGARVRELEHQRAALKAHQEALERQENRQKLERVGEAREKEKAALAELERSRAQCQGKPERALAERRLAQWRSLREALEALELESSMESPVPQKPAAPPPLQGLDGQAAREQVRQQLANLPQAGSTAGTSKVSLWGGFGLMVAGVVLLLLLPGLWKLLGAALLASGGWLSLWTRLRSRRQAKAAREAGQALQALLATYEVPSLQALEQQLQAYESDWSRYQEALALHTRKLAGLEVRRKELLEKLAALTGSQGSEAFCREQRQALEAWDTWASACRAAAQARGHREAMEAVTAGLESAPLQDGMTLSPQETRQALEQVSRSLEGTRSQLDACRGHRSALGDRERLEAEAESLSNRVTQLETYLAALNYGLAALDKAQRELQSRFAPRITAEARDILGKLTGGRYDRLALDQNLSLSAGAAGEDTLHPLIWRSDGTGDQLYLALRLAVSRALIPEAPLVLDDALNRFDETRLTAALALLQKENRQVLLFTCQNREARLLDPSCHIAREPAPGPLQGLGVHKSLGNS